MAGMDEKLKLMENDEDHGESDSCEVKPRAGLAERMAVRAGFNAPKLNTDRIRSSNFGSFAEVQSSCMTIPPGLSPTSFLESPVFMSNSLVQPSPTTGKLELDYPINRNGRSAPASTSDSFVFKPLGELKSNANPNNNMPLTLYLQQSGMGVGKPSAQSASPNSESPDPGACVASTGDLSDSLIGDEIADFGEGENRGETTIVVSGVQSEDEYNWRKYGQKQVKGSEYPRSYYKCTHPNCQVKKKVERSFDGIATEITYHGSHNHPRPASQGRRLSFGPGLVSFGDTDVAPAERPDSHSFPAVLDEHRQGSEGFLYETGGGSDLPSNLTNEDDEHGGGAEEDELESKRRRLDLGSVEGGGASRAVREPRVVVQTTSEVDILDDGYRWRKYGQKVVKGNPNPRSYYKCTNPGCTVRKHVERASHDLKSVITTYEGKHNHDVPAVRSSSQSTNGLSGCGSGGSASAPPVNRRPLQALSSFEGPQRPLPPPSLPPLGPFAQASFPIVGQTMWALRNSNGWPGGYRQHEDPASAVDADAAAAAAAASAAGQFGSGAEPPERGWFRETQG
ncbi:WRKY DNA-binding protein 2 [Wolffia australiana]